MLPMSNYFGLLFTDVQKVNAHTSPVTVAAAAVVIDSGQAFHGRLSYTRCSAEQCLSLSKQAISSARNSWRPGMRKLRHAGLRTVIVNYASYGIMLT